MGITRKKYEERYEELVRNQAKLVRSMTEPKSAASRMYPKLKSAADDQPKQGKFQGWAHLRSQQKEK